MFSILNTPFKIIAALATIGGLVSLLVWLWGKPETWNGAANGYLIHVRQLSIDSAYWHGRSDRADSVIVVQKTTIGRFRTDSVRVAKYSDSLQTRYNTAIAISDANAERLSENEMELAHLRNLWDNGTLKRPTLTMPTLKPTGGQMLLANYKTSERLKVSVKAVDSLGRSSSQYKVQSERQGHAIAAAGSGLARISKRANQDVNAGFWVFGKRVRKLARAVKVMADSTQGEMKKAIEGESELEKISNKKDKH